MESTINWSTAAGARLYKIISSFCGDIASVRDSEMRSFNFANDSAAGVLENGKRFSFTGLILDLI